MKSSIGFKIFFGVVVASVLGAVAFGIYIVGSPSQQRLIQFDQRRISDLQQISFAVDAFWQINEKLPAGFDDLKNQRYYYIQSVTDPKTGVAYEYRVLGDKLYELCAIFETNSSQSAERIKVPAPFSEQSWNHGIGRTCFQREEMAIKKP